MMHSIFLLHITTFLKDCFVLEILAVYLPKNAFMTKSISMSFHRLITKC